MKPGSRRAVRQPYARVDFILPVRDYEFGIWQLFLPIILLITNLQNLGILYKVHCKYSFKIKRFGPKLYVAGGCTLAKPVWSCLEEEMEHQPSCLYITVYTVKSACNGKSRETRTNTFRVFTECSLSTARGRILGRNWDSLLFTVSSINGTGL